MLPPPTLLRTQLRHILAQKAAQGHEVAGLAAELEQLPDSYDALAAFARRLAAAPLRSDWPYVEPNEYEAILAECDPDRPTDLDPAAIDLDGSARRVEAAFLGRVCGCVLGKPIEINASLEEIREALQRLGEWPLSDYISERFRDALPHPRLHPSWVEAVRERICYVPPDDDINYTILAMLLLEEHGTAFTHDHIRDLWLQNLPILSTWGPERTILLKAGINTLPGGEPRAFDEWVALLNPGDELCGALIRADAYGYACPGQPGLAAMLAWKDASFTHRRTGIYGAMFIAAAIALAPVLADPLQIFEQALKFVPRRSRFYHVVADALSEIASASNWLDGYKRIHGKYAQYTHCQIYQEIGTLINTLRFAESVGDGICKQVAQGNDTDSFGATAGSLLGAYFGPGHLEPRWLKPFNDDIRTTLARFYERSLYRLSQRMAQLPFRIAAEPGARH